MSIKKQYLKSKPVCKVSFKVSAKEANGAKKVQILGDFNNWNEKEAPMKALKSGGFSQTISLDAGKEYQFRYLMDGKVWANDGASDGKVANDFNEHNDVVSTVQ